MTLLLLCNTERCGLSLTLRDLIGEDQFFSWQAVIDGCDRMIIPYHLGLTGKATDAPRTLAQAVAIRQAEWVDPPVIRTDNGPPLIAQTFEQECHPWGIEHERIPVHSPNDNTSMESWHAPRERECLNRQEFDTYPDGYRGVTRWIEDYHTIRIPSGLSYGSPQDMRTRVA